jgi:hypothetical protein
LVFSCNYCHEKAVDGVVFCAGRFFLLLLYFRFFFFFFFKIRLMICDAVCNLVTHPDCMKSVQSRCEVSKKASMRKGIRLPASLSCFALSPKSDFSKYDQRTGRRTLTKKEKAAVGGDEDEGETAKTRRDAAPATSTAAAAAVAGGDSMRVMGAAAKRPGSERSGAPPSGSLTSTAAATLSPSTSDAAGNSMHCARTAL